MNDDIREKLSAYLDGALNDAERRAVEVEISRSDEMRLELESLRAVSGAVKGLKKEALPAGFMARLNARRARDTKPARDYYILPPSYRPLALALSTAVVALVIWDKTLPPPNVITPRVGWDSEIASVKMAADAPPSIDVTGKVAALGAAGKNGLVMSDELSESSRDMKKEDAEKLNAASTFRKHISAPGKPLEIQETIAGSGMGGTSAPASPAPRRAQFKPTEGADDSFHARSEEERSAINERLYKGFEAEKKRMGIAKIMDKDSEEQDLASGGREFMTLQATPEAARLGRRRDNAPIASVRGAAKQKSLSPVVKALAVKALALKSSAALQAAWAAAGLEGKPPEVNFPDQMAIFLVGPEGCGIVKVENRTKLLVILYKNTGFDTPSARVQPLPLSAKPVVVKLVK